MSAGSELSGAEKSGVAQLPHVQFVVNGTVREVSRKWRWFGKQYLLIDAARLDLNALDCEVQRRFPGHASLGTRGPAIPVETPAMLEMFPVGTRVAMTFAVSNAIDQYFLGTSSVTLEVIEVAH